MEHLGGTGGALVDEYGRAGLQVVQGRGDARVLAGRQVVGGCVAHTGRDGFFTAVWQMIIGG